MTRAEPAGGTAVPTVHQDRTRCPAHRDAVRCGLGACPTAPLTSVLRHETTLPSLANCDGIPRGGDGIQIGFGAAGSIRNNTVTNNLWSPCTAIATCTAVATNILKVGGYVDPLKPEGQIDLSRNLQIATAAVDSTGMCLFIAFAIMDQPDTFQALIDLEPRTASRLLLAIARLLAMRVKAYNGLFRDMLIG